MAYASDSHTGSTDEYETDNHHPPSDDENDTKFLKGGRLSRSPERAPPARSVRGVTRGSSPRRSSPRRRANNSGNGRSNGAVPGGSTGRQTTGSSSNRPASSNNASLPKTKQSTSCDDSYAGDDSDYESDCEVKSKIASQCRKLKYPIGTAVSKQFDGEWYSGKVTEFHAADELYSVLYDDGDTEDYNEEELEKLVNNAKKGNTKDSKAKSYQSKSVESVGSDSDSDDPFSHLGRSNKNKRRFQYSDSESEESVTSTEKRDASKKKGTTGLYDSDNSDDELFNNNSKRRAIQKKKTIALDSSDSDSDIEIEVKSPPKKLSPKKISSSATSSHNPSLRAQSEHGLDKSRAVLEKLKKSKQYHAEELEEKLPTPSRQSMDSVYDVDDSSVEALENPHSKPAAVAAKPSAIEYTGNLLKLKLRYKDMTNKAKDIVLRIKSDEPLKCLNEKFQGGVIKSLHFDGENLDMNKPPQFYDMDDDDLVDAVVAESSSSGVHRAAASDILKLVVRRSGTTSSHDFGMPKTAPLSKLIDKVCEMFKVPSVELEYNGRKLDPTKSCQAEGIPSNATLDAVAGQTISLDFRVNGDKKDVHKINASTNGTFKHAMEAFAAKKKCSISECTFVFDGEILQPMTSVESLDLEGGEIIDVKLNVAVSNPPPLQDDDGDAVMADAAAVMISVKTVRNHSKTKPKSWKVSNADSISVLNQEYVKYYKSKGCTQVKFYFNNTIINVETKSFRDLGIVDGATIYATENGKPYK